MKNEQVWPSKEQRGTYWYRFKQAQDSSIVYTGFVSSQIGTPDEKNPLVVVEFDAEELEYLRVLLAPSNASVTRTEIAEEALSKLEQLRKKPS